MINFAKTRNLLHIDVDPMPFHNDHYFDNYTT